MCRRCDSGVFVGVLCVCLFAWMYVLAMLAYSPHNAVVKGVGEDDGKDDTIYDLFATRT